MLWYKAGAADEPRGKSGIAHFLEHLLFKGTKTPRTGRVFTDNIHKRRFRKRPSTSWDYTGYYQRVAVNLLPLMMELESDRMQGLILTQEDVLTERDVILEERNSRVENKPSALFGEHMARLRYPNHPYGIPIIGWWHEMEALSQQDALEFYRANYAPNNAILVVAGDVQPDEVLAMAKTHYGGFETGRYSATFAGHRTTRSGANSHGFHRCAGQSTLYYTHISCEIAPIGASNGRPPLCRCFRISLARLGLPLSWGRKCNWHRKYPSISRPVMTHGRWIIAIFPYTPVPAQGVSLQDLETALDATIAAFLAQGVDDAHLARIKTQIEAEQIYALDNQSRLARQFGASLSSGLSVADVLEWPGLLQSITAEEVMEAARGVLNNKSTVTGWLMGEEEEETMSETISETISEEGGS